MEQSQAWFDVDLVGQSGNEEYRVLGTQEAVESWANGEKANYGYLHASVTEAEPVGAEFKTDRKVKAIT
ncbi:MAG: hypothetical protein CL840_15415 [Crocinitomicaceae bacterium]|nr:hypothetical protein [Crocinitomicaceae bacterium]|tara:strand:+ start:288 stop:494 length:207 start_codon:yes stop_codon:yes gene_type:complete